MRQRTWGRLSGRVWAIFAWAAVAALVLGGPGSDAYAQTFNDAIQGALDNNCQRLPGPQQGTLFTICGGGGSLGSGAGTSAGASIASQALGQQGADQPADPAAVGGAAQAQPRGRRAGG